MERELRGKWRGNWGGIEREWRGDGGGMEWELGWWKGNGEGNGGENGEGIEGEMERELGGLKTTDVAHLSEIPLGATNVQGCIIYPGGLAITRHLPLRGH